MTKASPEKLAELADARGDMAEIAESPRASTAGALLERANHFGRDDERRYLLRAAAHFTRAAGALDAAVQLNGDEAGKVADAFEGEADELALLTRLLVEDPIRCIALTPNVLPSERCTEALGHGRNHRSESGVVWVGGSKLVARA